jgi:hypothetical protein
MVLLSRRFLTRLMLPRAAMIAMCSLEDSTIPGVTMRSVPAVAGNSFRAGAWRMTKRKRYRPPSRHLLDDLDGPPVRVRDVAAWAGFSKDKVLDDARRGELEVVWRKCGRQRWAFVEREEARRYLLVVACLGAKCST